MVVTCFKQLFGHTHLHMVVYVSHISYTLKHYGAQSSVVFSWYGSTNLTTIAEQTRRAQTHTSSEIIFHDNRPTTTTEQQYRLTVIIIRDWYKLLERMFMADMHVKQAEADADTLIVWTALTKTESEKLTGIVVGTDTDLMVMLVARATPSTIICMLCRSSLITLYNIHENQQAIGDTTLYLIFPHALTGSNTLSAIYFQGKRKAFNIIHTNTTTMNFWTQSQRLEARMTRWKVQEENVLPSCTGPSALNHLMNTARSHTSGQLVKLP